MGGGRGDEERKRGPGRVGSELGSHSQLPFQYATVRVWWRSW